MPNDQTKPRQRQMQDLQPALLEADDHKIRRVLAIVDDVKDAGINRALLDTLRPRLVKLRPVRPLRFTRVLFTPLDALTVPLRAWRQGDPTVPRPAMAPIASIVRSGLGDLAPVIDGIIAGQKADAAHALTRAGELLWPRAAGILATASAPADWPDTGLPMAAYRPLAACIAAVLRCAPHLRCLAVEEESGGLTTDTDVVTDILDNLINESETACAMIARLILVQSPHALPVLGRIAEAGRTLDERVGLRAAVDRAVASVLTRMERDTGFAHELGHGPITADVAAVRRVVTILSQIEDNDALADHWPRLNALRRNLDAVCRTRFAHGLQEDLVGPLAISAAPLDAPAQSGLEVVARELRKLELMARKLGDPAGYDALLQTATDAVVTAADAGTLTSMRKYRLVEILAGSDAAEALYVKETRGS